jgi:hypothetical protein
VAATASATVRLIAGSPLVVSITTTPDRRLPAMLSITPATSPELGSDRITTSTAATSSAALEGGDGRALLAERLGRRRVGVEDGGLGAGVGEAAPHARAHLPDPDDPDPLLHAAEPRPWARVCARLDPCAGF